MSHTFHNPILNGSHVCNELPALTWLVLAAAAVTLMLAVTFDPNGGIAFAYFTT